MQRRMLVAYMAHSTFTGAVFDYLTALKRLPDFEVDFVNVEHEAVLSVDLDSYDVVFNNFCVRLIFDDYVSVDYLRRLRKTGAVKVLAVQDEYDNTNRLKRMITDCGFDIVLTCVPQDSLSYVYPLKEFPNVDFVTVFTGYVAVDFAEKVRDIKPLADRTIAVGYRGRDIGGRYGRMGFDKFEIGRRAREIFREHGITHDIEMDEASRIYGDAWFDFIGSCKTMLGTESGSNVFDFDGSIAKQYEEMREELGRPPSYEDFLPIVEKRDGEIEMGQISPRVFECAVMRTGMVLYRGRYSDALVADEHYIPLEKDFSNIEDVLRKVNDLDYLEKMVNRTYNHLVASGNFGYSSLLDKIHSAVGTKLHGNDRQPAAYSPAINWRAANPMKNWEKQPATSEPLPSQFFRYQRGHEKQEEHRNLLGIFLVAFKSRLEDNERYFRLFERHIRKSDSDSVEPIYVKFRKRLDEQSPKDHIERLKKLIEEYKTSFGSVKTHNTIDTITEEEFVQFEELNSRLLNDAVKYQQEWNEYDKTSNQLTGEMGKVLLEIGTSPISLFAERMFRFLRRVKRRVARTLER